MTAPDVHPLMSGYLAQRDALRRFFRARAGAAADVEDLLQDLYLKVVAVDPATEIRDVNAFLYRLASNLMMDRWRSGRRGAARDGAWRTATVATSAGEDVADAPAADTVVMDRQRLEVLLRTVEALPDKTRKIFRMHKFEGLSHAEVATRLEISRSSVEKHMIDALRILSERVSR